MAHCKECGKECETQTIDDGIGGFEYWGSEETDHQYIEVSDCCEADVSESCCEICLTGDGDSQEEISKCFKCKAGDSYVFWG